MNPRSTLLAATRRSSNSILRERLADVVDRLVLLPQRDNEAANTVILEGSRRSLRRDEELAIGITAKRMNQLPKTAERVAELVGYFPPRPLIDKIGPAGLEHLAKTTGKTALLQSDGAKCGAFVSNQAMDDGKLRKVIEAWPTLPEPTKARILEMVCVVND